MMAIQTAIVSHNIKKHPACHWQKDVIADCAKRLNDDRQQKSQRGAGFIIQAHSV
jgi:hypothetical protein